ncbi:Uncharacterized protein C40H1.2 [Toxocara canis]|uniref:Uncharacterized protein C40H1.2 n=1 Tax=Toxocara canis TaxID=6265 RepID=A0A0B2VHY6_TOXCA|nr:Uncharacterized protein C40H1.2 [Toxocara canis]
MKQGLPKSKIFERFISFFNRWCTTDNKCYPSVNFCPLMRQAQIIYNCPVDALKAPSYSESFAARFALPMVAAAMRECFAYLAYLTDAHAAVLVFRGSTEEQVLHDVLRTSFGRMVHLHAINGSVYEFYFDAFSNLWHAIEVDLRTLVRSDRSMRVWVPHSFRLINKNDIIPTLPARAFPFSHNGPFHHRYEVWYPQGISTGAWHVLATMAEDGRSSNSVMSLSVKDHLFAFDKNIAEWWRHECIG